MKGRREGLDVPVLFGLDADGEFYYHLFTSCSLFVLVSFFYILGFMGIESGGSGSLSGKDMETACPTFEFFCNFFFGKTSIISRSTNMLAKALHCILVARKEKKKDDRRVPPESNHFLKFYFAITTPS